MILIEYEVSEDYLNLYYEKLRENKDKFVFFIGVMCEKIIKKNGNDVVLVLFVRVGIFIGILVKRYIRSKYNISLFYYIIFIIRDKGIDMNVIEYIVKNYLSLKI